MRVSIFLAQSSMKTFSSWSENKKQAYDTNDICLLINFKTDLMSTFVSYACFFFSDQDENVFMEQED